MQTIKNRIKTRTRCL